MNKRHYTPLTALEVAAALRIEDCDEMTGEDIARDMLKGLTRFTKQELLTLADYVGLTVDELLGADEQFGGYRSKGQKAKTELVKKLLRERFSLEMAAELCDMPLDMVIKIAKK